MNRRIGPNILPYMCDVQDSLYHPAIHIAVYIPVISGRGERPSSLGKIPFHKLSNSLLRSPFLILFATIKNTEEQPMHIYTDETISLAHGLQEHFSVFLGLGGMGSSNCDVFVWSLYVPVHTGTHYLVPASLVPNTYYLVPASLWWTIARCG